MEDYVYYAIIWVLAICGAIVLVHLVEEFYRALKKRRKNRRLQKLVVYGDTKTRLLHIQNPLPDSPETLRERRRSLSQWLGSRATDDCKHDQSIAEIEFDIDYRKYYISHKCVGCGKSYREEVSETTLLNNYKIAAADWRPKWVL